MVTLVARIKEMELSDTLGCEVAMFEEVDAMEDMVELR